MEDDSKVQGNGRIRRTRVGRVVHRMETRHLSRLRFEVVSLKREVRATMDVDLSVATTVTAFFLVATLAGVVICAKDCDPLRIFDYLTYVFPIWAAWMVGIGLYVRRWIFRSFKLSVLFLLAGLMSYFASKELFTAFLGQFAIFALPVTNLILMFVPRPRDQPERREWVTIVYGVFLSFTVTMFIVTAVMWLPQSNIWFETKILSSYEHAKNCDKHK